MGVDAIRALAAAVAVAFGKRHVDGDGVTASAVFAHVPLDLALHVAAPGNEQREENTRKHDHGFVASGDQVMIHLYSPSKGSPEGIRGGIQVNV